jgi:hypothetical protein
MIPDIGRLEMFDQDEGERIIGSSLFDQTPELLDQTPQEDLPFSRIFPQNQDLAPISPVTSADYPPTNPGLKGTIDFPMSGASSDPTTVTARSPLSKRLRMEEPLSELIDEDENLPSFLIDNDVKSPTKPTIPLKNVTEPTENGPRLVGTMLRNRESPRKRT